MEADKVLVELPPVPVVEPVSELVLYKNLLFICVHVPPNNEAGLVEPVVI